MKTSHRLRSISIIGIFLSILSAAAFTAAQETGSKDYIIGAGDKLQIQVWDHNDLNRTVEVAHDGTFSFPFIGKVKASGKSVFDLEKYLVRKLSDGYLVGPQVTVSVAEYNNNKVFLFGEVTRPGSYVLMRDMRLLELISDAGGFTAKRGTTCTIIRTDGSQNDARPVPLEKAAGHEIIAVNLTRLLAGDPKENIQVQPNDSIYVNAVAHIFVTGEVNKPGEVEYTDGMTVRQAISMAGGGTPKAAVGRTYIVRMKDGKETEIKPALSDSVSPNDVLKVPESYF